MGMKELVDELKARRQRALAMGGSEAIAKQHAEGKLTVRERVERLFDPDSFHEIGLLATHANISPAMKGKETPADGVVTGFGKINGRPASLIAYDFTVMAGSMGRTARGQVQPRPRDRAQQAHADGLAHRLGGSPHPGGHRLDFRPVGLPLPRGVHHVGGSSDGGGHDGTGRRGYRVHPGAGRLRPDGQGHEPHGAGRPAPGQGGRGRGCHAGGAGRLQGPHRDLGRGRPRGARRRRLHRRRQGVPLLLPVLQPRAAADAAVRRPGGPDGRGAARASCRTARDAPTT